MEEVPRKSTTYQLMISYTCWSGGCEQNSHENEEKDEKEWHYEYQDDEDVSEVPMKMRKRGRKSAVPG